MKKNIILYGLWGCFYILCMVLGYTVTTPITTAQQVGLTVISLAFFVPPTILLIDSYRQKDQKGLRVLRIVSGLSLGLTFFLLILNVLSAAWPEAAGEFLNQLLILVSVPMATCGNWLVSLFLWACLLFATFTKKKQ
jgi:putative effector of murein hydrolase LrgA (UPF0299 family)